MSEWKEYTLGELTTDGKGTYGIAASAVDYCAELPTYLRITDINDDGTIDFAGLKSVDAPNSSNYILKENDIVFARTGASTGRSYFYDKRDGDFVYAGFLIRFSLDPQKVNPRILKYYTHSRVYYNWVHSFENGATRGNINAKTLAEMKIILPPRQAQDKIVSILSSLDDKIAVNRRICENLETQAQALFKNWFVDFAHLKMISIDEISVKVTDGVHNTVKDEINGDYMLLSCKNIVGGTLSISDKERTIGKETFDKLRKRTELSKGDILISTVGTVGEIVLLNEEPNNIEFQRSVGIIKPDTQKISSYYLYLALKQRKNELIHSAHGAVQQCIFISDLKKFEIIDAPKTKIDEFDKIVIPIFEEIKINQQENLRLSTLRDTLLPKLMSGEIKI